MCECTCVCNGVCKHVCACVRTQAHLGHVQLVVLAHLHVPLELSCECCSLHGLVGVVAELVEDDLAVHDHEALHALSLW